MTEIWRPVVGYESLYLVSDRGNVFSLRSGKPLRIQIDGDDAGRARVCLSNKGSKTHKISKLVAAAFMGPCPPGMEVCHNDGDPTNNNLDNLRYDTHSSNMKDRTKHGRNYNALKTECVNGHEYTK